jgi:hypothetical protein
VNTQEIFETPHDCAPKKVFMLTAYLDESAHESRDVMILAGFLGDAAQWKICEENWRIALGKKQHLHMNELRWSKPDRLKRLLDCLGPVPHSAGLQVVFSTARMKDYDDLIVGTKIAPFLRSYYFSLMGIISLIAKGIPADETFKIVLESNQRYMANANGLFQMTRGLKTPDGRPKLVSLEFVDKGVTLLTEPGDYLAYALLQTDRDPTGIRAALSSPILKHAKPAWGVKHHHQPELLRQLVTALIEKHPALMEKPHD